MKIFYFIKYSIVSEPIWIVVLLSCGGWRAFLQFFYCISQIPCVVFKIFYPAGNFVGVVFYVEGDGVGVDEFWILFFEMVWKIEKWQTVSRAACGVGDD